MPDRMIPRNVTHLLADQAVFDSWARSAGIDDSGNAQRIFKILAEQGVSLHALGNLIKSLGQLLPLFGDADRLLVTLGRFLQVVPSPSAAVAIFEEDPEALDQLLEVLATSPFLGEIIIAEPDVWESIRRGGGRPEKRESLRDVLRSEVGNSLDSSFVMHKLRRFKRREILRIAYGDIVKQQRLETVVDQISAIAECVIDEALRVVFLQQQQRRGTPLTTDGRPATIAVVALGKLGGNELNYSSDVDLIFCYSEDGDVAGSKTCTTGEFFTRVVQEVTRMLNDQTELGAAYRVDLRLRPHGGQGPLVLPRAALQRYYDRQGRTWERQAWVKARCIAGDRHLGEKLLAELHPWIYSRWLPRTEISGIRALKRQIEQRSIREGVDSADLKTGRGGIRDIEFTIQFLQLLNGGDEPEVRVGNTIEAIQRLAATGSLNDQEREILERNYRLLRTVEHRLQILHDRQTHRLPEDEHDFARLASRLRYGSHPNAQGGLRRDLEEATRLNRRILDHLLHDAFPGESTPTAEVDLILDPDPPKELVDNVLRPRGFRDIPQAYRMVTALSEESSRFLSSRRCRHFFAAIVSRLLDGVSATPDPDATLTTLVSVSDSLGGKGMLWELLSESPGALDLTIRFCSAAPFLAELLIKNPGMIDELQDSLLGGEIPVLENLEGELWELCGRHTADILPSLMAFKVSKQLRIGINDLLEQRSPHMIAASLSDLADALMQFVVHSQSQVVPQAIRSVPHEGNLIDAMGFIVLAMGKFGGREMNYASDVDVIFLYDEEVARSCFGRFSESELGLLFGDVAHRVLKIFNRFIPQGRLYEVDSRLRPGGQSGPIVTSLKAFGRYFSPEGPAVVWERQALVKARVVAGGKASADRVRDLIKLAIYEHSWKKADVHEIYSMRLRMEETAAKNNLKRGPGGVVDIEFLVQMLQLIHGRKNSNLQTPSTLLALEVLADVGVIENDTATSLRDAYGLLRKIEGRLRLLDVRLGHTFPAGHHERNQLANLLDRHDGQILANEVFQTTRMVRRVFQNIFSQAESHLAENEAD
ncbi:MAG: bifunctional [glutamate--ammonia ligase]-adenylyl-L-tyrosine phosphorylase/[glutamate--ammonia-ligase] adenylyltransferase [Planctomycetaceae bacterium]|nr:bifunctional [glutamate--ammonia ligase]-adenylyl-L-tyrosine phosphorylase/[glutamate--ammonia-ligase] adenylyltransferase [Planctomycetaceae bacterium]